MRKPTAKKKTGPIPAPPAKAATAKAATAKAASAKAALAKPRAKPSPTKEPSKEKRAFGIPSSDLVSEPAPREGGGRAASDDVAFAFSMFAYATAGLATSNAEEKAERKIREALAKAAPQIGRWELSWGPSVQQLFFTLSAINTMFVARSLDRPGDFVVAITGTNPTSVFDWLVEDVFVSKQVQWPYAKERAASGLRPPADAAASARIAQGTAVGLSVLQVMMPSAGRPGAGTTVQQHLSTKISKGARVLVTGHSLGGALSPVFAQWLSDVRAPWDPEDLASVTTTCFAGPSPGNAAFAAYCAGEHGVQPRRFAGSLDVVPHAREEALLDQVPGLYKPAIREPLSIIAATATAKWLARGAQYRHVEQEAAPLPFKVNKRLVTGFVPDIQFGVQMVYQHLVAYYPAFHFDEAWAPWFALLGGPERAVMPSFRGFSPTVVAGKSRVLEGAPRRRKVLVGQQLVDMPEHGGDTRAPSLTKELEKALAKQG